MKIDDRIYELISGKLDDRLSPMENAELSSWLAEDVGHEEVYAEIKKIRDQVKLLHRDFAPDTENVLKRVKRGRGRQIGFRYWWKYAALFILPLGVVLVLWQGMKNEPVEEHRQFSAVSRPGGERAILKLYDGKTVMLDSTMKSSLIAHEASVRIEMDSNHLLRYSSCDSIGITDANKNNELIIPKGGEYQVVLADGTKVWLNSASRLIYPQSFMGKERRVVLSGEAFFDVAHKEHLPFVVHSPLLAIKVLGTKFNVKAYFDEKSVVTLAEGKVEVETNDCKNRLTLKPNEQVSYSGSSGLALEKNINTNTVKLWMKGEGAFIQCRLDHIVRDLERKFDVKIVITDHSLSSEVFTCRFKDTATIEQVLHLLKETRRLDYLFEGEQIRIFKPLK